MIKLYKQYLRPFLKEVTIGPLFKLTEAIFELLVPTLMAKVIDIGVGGGDGAYVWRTGLIIVALGVVGLGCALVCQYFAARASQGVGTNLRHDIFQKVGTLSYSQLDSVGTSSLINRITNDTNQVQLSVAMLIRLVVRAPFLVIGATVMAVILDWKLSLVFFITIPIVAVILYLVMRFCVPYYRNIQKKLDRVALITRENLSGARVIKAYHREDHENARFEAASEDVARASQRVGWISALLNPLTYIVLNFAIVAILYFGGWRVNVGGLTQGQIVALVNYLNQILLALVVVANLVVIFTKAAASAGRINEILDMEPEIVDGTGAAEQGDAPKIAFENVRFSYSKTGEDALQNISLRVGAGQTLGIIGGTGSGKSTVVNLIPRFYDVTDGRVKIDGVDVRNYKLDELRHKIGIVPQRALLFGGTIEENMRWRKEDASEAEIKRALDIAQASEFVEKKEEGLQSRVEQGGKNLSGGQRQRLSIARALVGNPEIVILDDSASALDFATDAALRRAIATQLADATTIIVSQRASTVKNADTIAVLDDGALVGLGSHDELFKTCEVYREICLSQLSAEEVAK